MTTQRPPESPGTLPSTGARSRRSQDMAKKDSVTLDVSLLTSAIEEVTAIDQAIAASKGARDAVRQSAVNMLLTNWEDAIDIANRIQECLDWAADAEAAWSQLVDELTTAGMAGSGENVATLRERRAELINQATALQTVLVTMKVPGADEVVIPKASKGGGSGGSKGVKVSGARFYRVRDGVKEYQAAAQNSLSSLAYYYSKEIGGERLSTADFRKYLVANGLDEATESKGWEVRLSDKVSVGMEPQPTDEG